MIYCVETAIEYENSVQAGRHTGIHHSNIRRCCNGQRDTAGGWHWRKGKCPLIVKLMTNHEALARYMVQKHLRNGGEPFYVSSALPDRVFVNLEDAVNETLCALTKEG